MKWFAFTMIAAVVPWCTTGVGAAEMVIVDEGVWQVPVIVAEDAPEATVQAVDDFIAHLEKITGSRPTVIFDEPDPVPDGAIWIGVQPQLPALFPEVDIAFEHAEEILIACNGRHLAILGRDRMVETTQTEHGTANAIYTFMQKYLDVRWMKPWDREGLWLDIIERDTISLPDFVYRFHPPFRERKFWPGRPADWDRFHRLNLGSMTYHGGHAFTDWWEQYHEQHPEWFALRSDGTRTPPRWGSQERPDAVKLCVSNPEVWAQWLDHAEQLLRDDPGRITVSASPNDGGGFCVCDNCRAWDHPDGPTAGSDRYVKFWNILARGIRERFPDREVYVGAYAYSAYKSPPLEEKLEDNIAIGYVGHFPLANDEVTRKEKAEWKGWAEKATTMVYRPNLFHYSGGWLGLPTVAMRRTIEDFQFLAENNCVGLQVDTLPHNFATQGIQYYLMMQLAYDPYQDGDALLKDFYQRFFGPAADEIEAYFSLMEEAHDAIIDWEGFRHSSGWANQAVDIFRQVYSEALLAEAADLMRHAAAKAAEGSEVYQRRVEFIRDGFEFARLQVEIMHVMKRVRESEGRDTEAVRRALELCAKRDAMIEAGKGSFPEWYHQRVVDSMGPPSEEFQEAAGLR